MKRIYCVLSVVLVFVVLLCVSIVGVFATTDEVSNATINIDAVISQEEIEDIVHTNEQLRDIYGTWTSVIAAIFIVITVIGFAVPLYSKRSVDKKIKDAIKLINKENEIMNAKQIAISNALMLSASESYYASNKILEKLLEKDKNDSYLNLLIARNIFLKYVDYKRSRLELNDIYEIKRAIDCYIFVANNRGDETEFYELGAVFSNNIIHELCTLTGCLFDYYEDKGVCSDSHKVAVKVIETIKKILGFNSFSDIANEDQTNVHLMNYIGLNHRLADSYYRFGHIDAKKQYEYVLKLYSISDELNYEKQKEECTDKIKELDGNGIVAKG